MQSLWHDLTLRGGMCLEESSSAKLAEFLELLLAANQSMNLTRIADPAQAEIQHIGDALTLLPFLPPGPASLADIGSGGGVPGIPLAIVRPDLSVTLIESTRKKAAFLQSAAHRLHLKNLTVLAERAEAIARLSPRPAFEVVVARALAGMGQLAEWCLPLVAPGGKLLAMKGPKIAEELPQAQKTIRRLGGVKVQVHPVQLPGTEGRVVVEVHKKAKA